MDDKNKTPQPPEYLEFSQILEENHNDINVIPKDAPTITADLICLECKAIVQGPIRFYQHIRDYCQSFIERVDYVNQKDHFDREYRKLKDASLKDCYLRSIVKKKLVNDDDNIITCMGSSPLARYFEMDELKVWRKEQPPESTNAERLILRSSIDREGENFVLYYDFTDVQTRLAEERAEKERLAKEKAEKETNDDEDVDGSSEDETDEKMPDKSDKEPYVDSEEESFFKFDDEFYRNRRRSPSDYKADDWPIPKFPPKKPDSEDTPVTSEDDTPDDSSDSDESEGESGNEDGSHLNQDATDNHQVGNEDSAETDRSMAPIASHNEVEQTSEPPVYEHEVQSAHHASRQATPLYQNNVSGDVEGGDEKSSESASVQRKATSMEVVDEAAPDEQDHDADVPSDRSDAKEKPYERAAFNPANGTLMRLHKFLVILDTYKAHLTLVPKGETKEAAAASQHNLKKIYMEERFLRVEEDSRLLPFIMDENLIARFEKLDTERHTFQIQLKDGRIHRLVFLNFLNLSSLGPLSILDNATTSEIPADDRDLEEMEDIDVAPSRQAAPLYQHDVSADVDGEGERPSESASVQQEATSSKFVDEAAPEEQDHDAEGPSDRKIQPPEYLEFSQILEENHNDINVIPKDAPTITADLICLECKAIVQGPIRFYQHIRDYCESFIERVDYFNQKDHFDREYRKLKDSSLKDCYLRSIVKKKLVNDDDNVITFMGSSPLARYFEMDELKVWRKEQPPECTNAERLILRSSIDREGENFVLYYDFTDVQTRLAEERAEKERLAKEKAEKETNDDEDVDGSSEDETDEAVPDKSDKEPYVDSEEESFFKYDDEAHRNRRRLSFVYNAADWPIPNFPPKKPIDTDGTPVTSDSDESEGESDNEDGSHLNQDATDNHQVGNEVSAETERSMAPIASSHKVGQTSERPVYEHEVQSSYIKTRKLFRVLDTFKSHLTLVPKGETKEAAAASQHNLKKIHMNERFLRVEEDSRLLPFIMDKNLIARFEYTETEKFIVRVQLEDGDIDRSVFLSYLNLSSSGPLSTIENKATTSEIPADDRDLEELEDIDVAPSRQAAPLYQHDVSADVDGEGEKPSESVSVQQEATSMEIFDEDAPEEQDRDAEGPSDRKVKPGKLTKSTSGESADDRDMEEMDVDIDDAPATNNDDDVQKQVDVLPEDDTNQVELEDDEEVVDPIVTGPPNPQIDRTGSKYFEGLFAGYQGDDTNAETEEEIIKEWKEIDVAIVVVPDEERNLFARSRIDVIKTVDELKARIPNGCSEAERANQEGSFRCAIDFPGVPNKKFAPGDPENENQKIYEVQAVYEPKRGTEECTVLFEGWCERTSESIKSISESAPLILNVSRTRSAFLNMISETEHIKKKVIRPYRYWKTTENRGMMFWLAEDLTYFHSRVQDNYRLGPVIYVILHKFTKFQPTPFSFTSVNVLSVDIYKKCVSEIANEQFTPSNYASVKRQKIQGSCTNPNGCVCNLRFDELYQDQAELLQIQPNGLLDLDSFSPDRDNLIVECSEVCGCDSKCPRRRMQNGSKKHLIVYFRNAKEGYSLRSGASFGAGEYLGEFTGEIKKFNPNLTENQLQLIVMDFFMAISYKDIGNQFRFLNRSSSPNVILVETHSRRFESDPLLPRIGVYACKDIAFGEEMTMPE